jgi:hypothetical protein
MYRNYLTVFLLVALIASLSACKSNPFEAAETVEQKAYAAFGVFVVAQVQVGDILQNPAIPDDVKLRVQRAEQTARPVANSLVDAALEVETIREQLEAGEGTEERLAIATQNLLQWQLRLTPLLRNLSEAIRSV